jgi:hypothetical protein
VGILVGMAYVVARRDGRFEIRESIVTERGPRARTLANFSALTEDVLQRAENRAARRFDRRAVTASAIRRGAVVAVPPSGSSALDQRGGAMQRFLEGTRRFAVAADESLPGHQADPGAVFAELLHFADEVGRHQPPRAFEPLRYPVVRLLVANESRG